MHLAPHEVEKLMLHGAGFLAQKRLARGVRLNHPECVALIATQILEFIRDGNKSVAELMDLGRQLLGRRQVQPGVADMIHMVQVEGTFPDGTKLVTVHEPIADEDGNLELALYGSFLPIPKLTDFESDKDILQRLAEGTPGEMHLIEGDLVLNEGRATVTLPITNTGDRPIQVGSHYHFVETNPALKFDRAQAYGKRLDIPAGTSVRFEPGDVKTVTLVEIGGNQSIGGGNAVATGPVSDFTQSAAMERLARRGFQNEKA
jgi:urease beta subunit/urease gamma subunit